MLLDRIKPLDAILATAEKKSLHRTLGALQLTMFGIGCIIGADTYPGTVSDELLQIYSVAPVIADELKSYFRLQ